MRAFTNLQKVTSIKRHYQYTTCSANFAVALTINNFAPYLTNMLINKIVKY